MINYATFSRIYINLWNKYRPAILKLMIDSSEGPQQYKFSSHEFRSLNPKEKGLHFTLHVFQGKAVNNIRESLVAQDLLSILQQSKKATELMETSAYEFVMDRQFVLRIVRKEQVPVPA
jgi:hypothetical protein